MLKKTYKEFKTVMEMAYVVQKAYKAYSQWTASQIEEFEQAFAANLLRCYKNRRFCKEYADYEQAIAQKNSLKSPQTSLEKRLNRILKELELIDLACQPYHLDNKEIYRKQADTRLKYEKRINANQKASPLFYNLPKDK